MEIMVKYAAILPPQYTVLLKHIPRVWCRTVFRRNNGFTVRHSTQRLEKEGKRCTVYCEAGKTRSTKMLYCAGKTRHGLLPC